MVKVRQKTHKVAQFGLEELIVALKITKPEINEYLPCSGIYYSDIKRIFYNPRHHINATDLYGTLLHEVTHHFAGNLLDEVEVELSERSLLQDQKLVEYLKKKYGQVARRYTLP